MARGMNALVGAAVTTVLLAIVPFSPIVGGAVSGYLEGSDGIAVGALAGVIAVVPAFLLFALFGMLGLGIRLLSPVLAGITIALLVFGFVLLLAYVIVLSALGGLIGAYLQGEL